MALGQMAWADFQKAAIPIAVKVNDLLYNGIGSHDTKLRNQCKSLYAHNKRLWMFIANEGIEPTNNRAERAIRKAVIYRKLSFGTQSENGSRFVERIFSIAATCRMQKRSISVPNRCDKRKAIKPRSPQAPPHPVNGYQNTRSCKLTIDTLLSITFRARYSE